MTQKPRDEEMSDSSIRVQLEGRAALLAASALHHRVLVKALTSWRWRARLRMHSAVFQEVVRRQEDVDEAVETVRRRARAEGWSDSIQVVKDCRAVERHRSELLRLAGKRLGTQSDSLATALLALEQNILTAPRLVLPGQRWSTALEVLPTNLAEFTPVSEFARDLERLFGRPSRSASHLPLSLEELDAFTASWSERVESLERVWNRLSRIDATGSLVKYLRRRARRAPAHAPTSGPELLLGAEFWKAMAVAKMKEVLDAETAPIAWKEEERFSLLRWIWHRQNHLTEALRINDEPREALFELAAGLGQLSRTISQAQLVLGGLIPVARKADRAMSTDDWARVYEQLRLLVRVLWTNKRVSAPDAPRSLEVMIRLLQEAVSK